MLSRGRIWLKHHLHAARSSFLFLYRRPLATGVTVIIIAFALALPTLFWVFTDNLSKMVDYWQRSGQISLYLDLHLSTSEQEALLQHVRKIEGVGQAELKPPAEALAMLRREAGLDDLTLQLPENPLPPLIEVIPAKTLDTPAKIEALYLRLKGLADVDEAKLDLQWVNRLYALLDFAKQLAYGLVVLLGATVVFIVGNTLRLAVHHQREEIQLLKLMGATDAYIKRSFLYTGFWYSSISAVLAALFVSGFMLSLKMVLAKLVTIYQIHFFVSGLTFYQTGLLFLCAIGLGWLAAGFTINRQLASIQAYNQV